MVYLCIYMQVVYVVMRLVVKRSTVHTWNFVAFLCAMAAMWLCYSGLNTALSPSYSSTGDLVFAGADLSVGGMLEYYQDVAYLCMFALTVGAVTDWAWLVFLCIPLFAVFMAWKYIISPWLNAPSRSAADMYENEDEATRKRREKKERQQARKEKFAVRRM
jgi:hypothetical protein